MKIKKVEISAFRAFDKVEDATFDFTLPDDKVANFISIFAPNGYGKTSFYDAVEWCITGQIERFYRNAPENYKLGIENRKGGKEKSSFLQHHNQKTRLGSVTVLTDNKTYTKNLTRKVFDFKQKSQNIFFKDVILSQDLIDTFIKEDKADDRYKKFIDSIPHLQDYNNALQNVIMLLSNANEKRKELTTDKKNKEDTQLELDFEGDVKILEEINIAISRLIDKKQKITLIQKESFSKKKFDELTQKVSSEITSLGFEIEALKLGIENIVIAYNGSDSDENNKGIVEYYNLKEKSKGLSSQKNKLIEILESIREKEKLEKLIINSKKDLKNVIELNSTHLEIKSDFEKYSKIKLEIQRLNKKVTDLGSEKEKAKITEQELFTKENNTKSDLIQKQNGLIIIKNRLKEFPENKTKFEKNNTEIIEVTRYIKKTEESINENKTYNENINLELEQNSFFQNKLKEDVELLLDHDFFKEYKSLIEEVVELQRKQEFLNKEIIELNNEINIQDDLKKELSTFLSRGIELIAENESTICPLCSQQYDSFVELSSKISNNKLLSRIQKNSLSKKSNLEIVYKDRNTIIGDKVKSLEDIITNTKVSIELKQIKNYRILKDLRRIIDNKKEVLDVLEKEKISLTSYFGGPDIKAIEKRIKIELKDVERTIKELLLSLNKIKEANKNNTSLILELDNEIHFLTNEIEKERKSNTYIKVYNYYIETLKSNTINLNILENEITKNEEIVLQLKLKDEKNTKSIKSIKKYLISNKLSDTEIIEKIENIEKVKLISQKVIQNYEHFISTDYDIDLVRLTEKETDKAFEILKSLEKEKLNDKDNLLKNYKIIEALKDDSYKFLVSEKTKKVIDDLKKEIKIINNIEIKLKQEKENLEGYLKRSIDGFFYTELINKIYRKIDPHPDYTEIEFDCDFKDKIPRLLIYTKDKEGRKSIPALYFSTAQINILSLSIFLARALKAKNKKTGEEVKCIFIDDPIQSMDSINILSFIDLFRSIMVSLDRQLIVATHEENFHLLLQKKIPKQLFKSKFIEFETFGKLKK